MLKHSLIKATFLALLSLGNATAQADIKKEMPEYYLQSTDSQGKPLNLSDYKGKTVLVSFFAAGCSLCTRDLKLMREFYKGNTKNNFVLLAVNLDQVKSDFDTYSQIVSIAVPKEQRFPMIWRNIAGHKDNFGPIKSQPTHFVIGPDGKFILKREGTFEANDWDNLWESLGK